MNIKIPSLDKLEQEKEKELKEEEHKFINGGFKR